MNGESYATGPKYEKPASEMSVDELRELLAQKEAAENEEMASSEEIDDSYLQMASGELASEENEQLSEQIEAAEAELEENLAETEELVAQADEAFEQAEAELEANPESTESKLTLEAIRSAYDSAKEKVNSVSIKLGVTGAALFAGTLFSRKVSGDYRDMGDTYNVVTNTIENYSNASQLWDTIGDVTSRGSMGAVAGAAAAYVIGTALNKLKQKKMTSKYFEQS